MLLSVGDVISTQGREGASEQLYHHGEDDGGGRGLDDPQQHQTCELGHSEEVHLPQRNVTQVDEVWLVLGRHGKQQEAVV